MRAGPCLRAPCYHSASPMAVLYFLRGALNVLLLLLILIFWFAPFPPVILLRAVVPHAGWRRQMGNFLVFLAERWAITTIGTLNATTPTRWIVESSATLSRDRSYLLLSNHVSWIDIFAVLHTVVGRAPFPRFFIKQELIWLPMVGQAAWALDFPFMKRYSPEYLARHPEKRGEDLEATRRACDRFRGRPVSIINYAEGTRFTREKHSRQSSPYRHLLKPRTGGVFFVLSAMGDCMDAVLDITVAYPPPQPSWWEYICGKADRIVVVIRELPIPRETTDDIKGGREHLRQWFDSLWRDKDEIIASVHDGTFGGVQRSSR